MSQNHLVLRARELLRREKKNLKNWWRNRRSGAIIRIQAGESVPFNWIVNYRYPVEMMQGKYEPEVTSFILKTLTCGDVFFDIGANAGYFSLLARIRVGASGKVIAFDPLPENVAMMRAVINANPSVPFEVKEAAIAAENGKMEFLITNNPANGRLINTSWELSKVPIATITVPTLSLKQLIQTYRPNMIKIDTEGAESQILKSLGFPGGWGCEPIFLLEFHGGDKWHRMFRAIAEVGLRDIHHPWRPNSEIF